jgi:hypothetical protein
MTKQVFNTRPYEMSHGATPRGRGSWAFCRTEDVRNPFNGKIVWAPVGTFAEAKKYAKAHHHFAGCEVIEVLP